MFKYLSVLYSATCNICPFSCTVTSVYSLHFVHRSISYKISKHNRGSHFMCAFNLFWEGPKFVTKISDWISEYQFKGKNIATTAMLLEDLKMPWVSDLIPNAYDVQHSTCALKSVIWYDIYELLFCRQRKARAALGLHRPEYALLPPPNVVCSVSAYARYTPPVISAML